MSGRPVEPRDVPLALGHADPSDSWGIKLCPLTQTAPAKESEAEWEPSLGKNPRSER
ncbi:hypothetical protein GCM10010320_45730 [Streptomyces caelestis]|nr:hypothetical protein GCM10010320_45730 [Streptomyces caelestis]